MSRIGKYRTPSNDDIRNICECARAYDMLLKGKSFLICYGADPDGKMFTLSCRRKNFLHLVGVRSPRDQKAARRIYNKALVDQLTPGDIGKNLSLEAEKKFSVFKDFQDFPFTASVISNPDLNRTLVSAEKWISGDKICFTLGAVCDSDKDPLNHLLVPASLQSLSKSELNDKSIGDPVPIAAIFGKESDLFKFDKAIYINPFTLDQSASLLIDAIDNYCVKCTLEKCNPDLISFLETYGLEPPASRMSIDDIIANNTAVAEDINAINCDRNKRLNMKPLDIPSDEPLTIDDLF